jgi:hypothetical protein
LIPGLENKQQRTGLGKALAAAGTGRPPMAIAFATEPVMYVLYTFRSRLAVPIEERKDRYAHFGH